jgi:hypothetical protein
LLGASGNFSFELFQWLAWTAQGLLHFSRKECQHVRFSAVYFWISGLYKSVFIWCQLSSQDWSCSFSYSYFFQVLELTLSVICSETKLSYLLKYINLDTLILVLSGHQAINTLIHF